MKINLIGGGALGHSLHQHFKKNDIEHLWFKAETAYFTKNDLLNEAAYYLFAVQESKLKPLLQSIHSSNKNDIFIHFSGSIDFTSFDETCLAKKIIMHPMYSFPNRKQVQDLSAIYFTFQGEELDKLKNKLLLNLIPIQLKNAKLYHALGVIAGNFQNALYQILQDLAHENNLSEIDAKKLLLPLSQQTLSNIGKMDLKTALSGPAKRGEWDLINEQELEIRKNFPEYADLYHQLNQLIKNKILDI